MRTRWSCLVALGVMLSLAAVPAWRARAGEAEMKAESPAKAEPAAPADAKEAPKAEASKEAGGLVGTVVAVVPGSRTLVVDVPLGKSILRVGATVTERTKITAGGSPAPFDRLKEGARVRIQFRRVPAGDEAISVEVL